MFKLLNKKPVWLFSRPAFFQIRNVPNRPRPALYLESTVDDQVSHLKTPIPIPEDTLQKRLGLVLKKPQSRGLKSGKVSLLESQLEEISLQSLFQEREKKEKERKLLGKNLIRHSVKRSPKASTLISPHSKKKVELEEQLTPVDFEVKSVDDFKDSPHQVLQKKYIEEETKKFDRNREKVKEYIEGEPGLDYLQPPEEMYENLISDIDYMKEGFDQLVADMAGQSFDGIKAQKMKWLAKKESQEKLEELQKWPVVEYPGSSKGAQPEDDPDHFNDWYERHAPPVLLDLKAQFEEMEKEEQGVEIQEGGQAQNINYEGLAGRKESYLEIASNEPFERMDQSEGSLVMKSISPVEELDPYPETEMMEWNENVEHVERWILFRMFPQFLKLKEYYEETIKRNEGPMIVKAGEMVIPSLYRYYYLLPKFVRDEDFVKEFVRVFEWTKPTMTIHEKEVSLNFMSRIALPLDQLSIDVATDLHKTTKYFLTEEDDEKFLNDAEPVIGEDEDDDLLGYEGDKELDEEKLAEEEEKKGESAEEKEEVKSIAQKLEEEEKAKLRKQKLELKEQIKRDLKDPTIDLSNKYGMWQRPLPEADPAVPEQPSLDLPLEYYDNDDGFWDDFIKEKERKYNNYPLIYNRQFFKH